MNNKKILIQRNESSYPIKYENVINAYTKGPMYCLMFLKDGKRVTHKFPLSSIFRVVEDYNDSFMPKKDFSEETTYFSEKYKDLTESELYKLA